MPADVSTGLPELDLAPYAIVTVTLDDPNAVILSMNVHGWQVTPQLGNPEPLPPLYVPALTVPPFDEGA